MYNLVIQCLSIILVDGESVALGYWGYVTREYFLRMQVVAMHSGEWEGQGRYGPLNTRLFKVLSAKKSISCFGDTEGLSC